MFEKEKERGSTKFTWLDPVYVSFSIINFAREVFFFLYLSAKSDTFEDFYLLRGFFCKNKTSEVT